MSILQLLKRVQLFSKLDDEALVRVANICEEVNVPADSNIIAQNTEGSEMYIIGQGQVEVYMAGIGDERKLVILGEGQMIGEMALIDQGYRSASVRAKRGGATLYKIERQAFDDLCVKDPKIGYIVMRNLAIDLTFKMRHQNLANK